MVPMKKIDINTLKDIYSKINKKAVFASVSLFLLLLFSIILADSLVALGRVHPGVKVGDINVGGLTKSEATKKLELKLEPALKKPIKISYQEKEWDATPDQFNTKISVPKSVEKAYAVGREGNLINKLRQRLSCWKETRKLSLVYSADYKLITGFVNEIAKVIDKEPTDAGVKIEGGKPSITSSQIGIKLKRADAFSQIRTKLVSIKSRAVEAPIEIIPVDITEEDAKEALKDTKEMMRHPLMLEYEDRNWLIDKDTIGSLIRFKKVEKSKGKKEFKLQAELGSKEVKDYINTLTKDVNIEPQNADFKVNGKAVQIIPSKEGLRIDTDVALSKMRKVVFGDPPRHVSLTTKVVKPERTTEQAEAMGINERISVFTTTYSASNTARVNNIVLLSKELDGTLVPPGKIFSFNDTIGPRTAEKGYKEAPTIVQGELVPSIGGGVCQVATTLFNTIFFGGFPVVSRQNHSFYIDHYPAGRDATVSWGGPDLKFKNDTDAYLLIKTWPSSSSVTVAIYGTNYQTEVSYQPSEFSNLKPFTTKQVEDPALPKGQQVMESNGIEGRDITVRRTVKRGGKVVREDKFFSRYKPKQAVVHVGTMEVPPPAQATPPPDQVAQ